MEGFPPTAMPAPQTVPSPAKLDGDGSSPRSIAAGEAHGFCPGSTGRTAPQPWLVPDLCMVSPSSKLTHPSQVQQICSADTGAKSGPPGFSTIWIFLPFEGFCYFCARTGLPPQGSERQPLPNLSLTPLLPPAYPDLEAGGPWDSGDLS